MSLCAFCGIDPDERRTQVDNHGEPFSYAVGHDCHCVHEGPRRVAVGICCGRTLGAELLAEEDASDERRLKRMGVA